MSGLQQRFFGLAKCSLHTRSHAAPFSVLCYSVATSRDGAARNSLCKSPLAFLSQLCCRYTTLTPPQADLDVSKPELPNELSSLTSRHRRRLITAARGGDENAMSMLRSYQISFQDKSKGYPGEDKTAGSAPTEKTAIDSDHIGIKFTSATDMPRIEIDTIGEDHNLDWFVNSNECSNTNRDSYLEMGKSSDFNSKSASFSRSTVVEDDLNMDAGSANVPRWLRASIMLQQDDQEDLVELPLRTVDDVLQVVERMGARNALALDVRQQSNLFEYMIVATGYNTAHLSAMTETLRNAAKKQYGLQIFTHDGKRKMDWQSVELQLPAHVVIINLLTHDAREYYALEEIWRPSSTKDEFEYSADEGLVLEEFLSQNQQERDEKLKLHSETSP